MWLAAGVLTHTYFPGMLLGYCSLYMRRSSVLFFFCLTMLRDRRHSQNTCESHFVSRNPYLLLSTNVPNYNTLNTPDNTENFPPCGIEPYTHIFFLSVNLFPPLGHHSIWLLSSKRLSPPHHENGHVSMHPRVRQFLSDLDQRELKWE